MNIKKIIKLILLGMLLLVINFNKEKEITNKIEIEEYKKNSSILNDENNNMINNEDNEYIAILEIPAISLRKKLYNINNKYNKVNYGIEIIKGSNMPNINNSNLVLASHSGNSKVSYFNDLDKLQINDKIYLYYNNYKYVYNLDNKYDVEKTGIVNVNRNINKNAITLITCDKKDNNKQNIYIGYLEN